MEPKQPAVGLSSVVDNLKTTCQGGECNLFSSNVVDENVSKISKISNISEHNKSVASKKSQLKDIAGGSSEELIFGFPRRVVFIAVTIAFVVFLYLWLKRRDAKRLQIIKDNLPTTSEASPKSRTQPPIAPVPQPEPRVPSPPTRPVPTPSKNPIIKPVVTKKPAPPKPPAKKPTLLRKPPAQNPLAGKKVSAQPAQRARPTRTPPPQEKEQPQPPAEEDFTYLKDL
ncbi:MAG: hypothetical protein CMO44_17515 [Verrucomicrobiales bacterium]|nr:hypothetical protein [Verrucomicrobiales bacterium]